MERKRNVILLCLTLAILVLAVYGQTWNHGFIDVDDKVYVTENPHVSGGLSLENAAWAFTSVEAANWHPVTWLSHMIDAQIYDMNAGGHHLTNVVIHTASSLILLLLLIRFGASLWQAAFVAFLFALHPLHVESVAWVAERKDVLSALFFFVTLHLYLDYAREPKRSRYLLCLVSFLLGLMSKPMLVTLPVVLLLIDFWPLERHVGSAQENGGSARNALTLIKEKIPFFVFSLLSAAVTVYAQHHGGATRSLEEIPFLIRLENVCIAYVTYLFKALWPRDLALLYIFPPSIPLWQALAALLVLVAVTAAVLRVRGCYPYLAAGWLWFVITLVPVIGLIQVGAQCMADRYTYIPLIGIFIMVAWGVPDLAKNLPYRQHVLGIAAGSALVALTLLTWQQVGRWQDTITLYRHTVQVTTGNYLIHYNLGSALEDAGEPDEGIRHYRETIRINPRYEGAHINLGVALHKKGDLEGAIREYREALGINPANAKTHNNLGVALSDEKEYGAAIREYQVALGINPGYNTAYRNLQDALAASVAQGAGTKVASTKEAAREGR